jgi:ubiquinone/menaquinone biosynthesis C-methylase UbiE
MTQGLYQTLGTLSASNNYNNWIYNTIKNDITGTILDIGSGLGDIAKFYCSNPTVKRVIFSDYSDSMVNEINKHFSEHPNYSALRLDISDSECFDFIPHNSIDTITCINVLEHIQDDEKAVSNMHGLLKSGGRLVILVPAFPFLYGTLDELVDHKRRYTKKSLSQLLLKHSFYIEKSFYMNIFGTITWFSAGKIFRHKRFEPNACRLLDKIVPILESMEKFITPPFGQSLVISAQKY